jgi:hypothetical protein
MVWPFDRSPKDKPSRQRGYPAAYREDERRPDVFDPALEHHPRAYVKGPPPGDDARATHRILIRVRWRPSMLSLDLEQE